MEFTQEMIDEYFLNVRKKKMKGEIEKAKDEEVEKLCWIGKGYLGLAKHKGEIGKRTYNKLVEHGFLSDK